MYSPFAVCVKKEWRYF